MDSQGAPVNPPRPRESLWTVTVDDTPTKTSYRIIIFTHQPIQEPSEHVTYIR